MGSMTRDKPARSRAGGYFRGRPKGHARGGPGGGQAGHRIFLPRDAGQQAPRFGFLLLLLVIAYLVSAFTAGTATSVVQIVLFLGATTLALRSGQLGRRTVHIAIVITVGGSAVAVTLALTHSSDEGAGVATLWAALVLLLGVVLIVRRVLEQPEVTMQSIFGAISAYMIIGLMFASVYSAMNRFSGGMFFVSGQMANVKTFQYFSFTTLTTLGYGDYTAGQSSGQAVAVMEALLGQIFLATLVARLVAAFRGSRRPDPAAPSGPPVRPARAGPGRRRPRSSPRRPPHTGGRRWPAGAGRTGPPAGRDPRMQPGAATRTSSPARAQPARRSRSRPGR
jgi:voltage-gated potassium channel Kch